MSGIILKIISSFARILIFMGQKFSTRYDTALKHFSRLSDSLRVSAKYLDNFHSRTIEDKNLTASDPKSVQTQIEKRPSEVTQILHELHSQIVDSQIDLEIEGISQAEFLKAIKIYGDAISSGHTSYSKTFASLRQELLPDIAEIFKLFEWVNNVIEVSNTLSKTNRDPYKRDTYFDIEDAANHALREFRRTVSPFVRAFGERFKPLIQRDMTVATREDVDSYDRLRNTIKRRPRFAGQDGFGLTTRAQRELKKAMQTHYVQDQFFNLDVESTFNQINDALDCSSLKKARKNMIEILESVKARSRAFKKDLATTLSYQIDKTTDLTIPQKIIRFANSPDEQEDALGILLYLKDFGVSFDGRNLNMDTSLHMLKTWHKSLAQFLTLLDKSSSKTAINLSSKTPQETFRAKFSTNDPFYNSQDFLIIDSLLSPGSADNRETNKKAQMGKYVLKA